MSNKSLTLGLLLIGCGLSACGGGQSDGDFTARIPLIDPHSERSAQRVEARGRQAERNGATVERSRTLSNQARERPVLELAQELCVPLTACVVTTFPDCVEVVVRIANCLPPRCRESLFACRNADCDAVSNCTSIVVDQCMDTGCFDPPG